MAKITLIAKDGCTKCDKMKLILEKRGHKIEKIMIDENGKLPIGNLKIMIDQNTLFPMYLVENILYKDFKSLNEALTITDI